MLNWPGIVILLAIVIAAVSCHPHGRRRACNGSSLHHTPSALTTMLTDPWPAVQGSDVHRGCLARKDDRLVIVGAKRGVEVKDDDRDTLWFLASDLCAMGHTTKDPAHLASFLLDHFAAAGQGNAPSVGAQRKLRLKLVYGNTCMTRKRGSGGNKRSGVFLHVLRGWFHAVLRRDSPLMMYLQTHLGVSLDIGSVNVLADHDAHTRMDLAATEVYLDDIDALQCNANDRPVQIVKRAERWRWFRTSWHADLFRQSLLYHHRVPLSYQQPHPPRVVILRRDEDRHFDEGHVHTMLSRKLRGVADVQMHTFDNIRGGKGKPPPSHAMQLAILHNASILIAAHGAGLANVAVMKPGSVVVELFPHNFRYYMYEELASLCNIKYIAFESPSVWPPRCCSGRGGDSMPVIHENKPSLVNGVGARACKKCDIRVSDWEWELMMRTALYHVQASSQM